MFELGLYFRRHPGRVLHLGEGGDDDTVLPGLPDVAGQNLTIHGQINHFNAPFSLSLPLKSLLRRRLQRGHGD
jgi:hypothetical protein